MIHGNYSWCQQYERQSRLSDANRGDRNNFDLSKSQTGFLQFICLPMFEVPQLRKICDLQGGSYAAAQPSPQSILEIVRLSGSPESCWKHWPPNRPRGVILGVISMVETYIKEMI